MRNINELKPKMTGVELQATVISLADLNKFLICYECNAKTMVTEQEFTGQCPGCGAKPSIEKKQGLWVQDVRVVNIKDDTGTAELQLWRNQVNMLSVGDKVHLINGYAREANQVMAGKYGKVEKIE